jgi:hypothetical protein
MKKVAGDGNPLLGLPLPVVLPEEVAWLFDVLSLYCQNKLGDVSPFCWMQQRPLLQMDHIVGAPYL